MICREDPSFSKLTCCDEHFTCWGKGCMIFSPFCQVLVNSMSLLELTVRKERKRIGACLTSVLERIKYKKPLQSLLSDSLLIIFS